MIKIAKCVCVCFIFYFPICGCGCGFSNHPQDTPTDKIGEEDRTDSYGRSILARTTAIWRVLTDLPAFVDGVLQNF